MIGVMLVKVTKAAMVIQPYLSESYNSRHHFSLATAIILIIVIIYHRQYFIASVATFVNSLYTWNVWIVL